MLKQEQELFQHLLQEVVFCHPSNSNQILEGSTFSLLALSNKDELVFFPNELTQADGFFKKDQNDGRSLSSTTIGLLQQIAKQENVPHRIQALTYDTFSQYKNIFAVSSTRIRFDHESVMLQPIASVNGELIPFEPLTNSDAYQQLMTGIRDYFESYTHTFIPVTTQK